MTLIAVCSGKGSPGATFVAVNLAAAMDRAGEGPLLLDLDPSGGDLCCYLGLDPRRGLYPHLRVEGGVPDLEDLLAEAEERAGFLAVSGFPEPSELASSEILVGIARAARSAGRTVLTDLGRPSELVGPSASMADRIILVVRPDLVSVLGAERALRLLDAGGVDRDRIDIVVSGVERRRPGDLAEVQDALRLAVVASVPLDRRGARKALLQQAPARTRRLRKAFDALASVMLRPEPDEFRRPSEAAAEVTA
jgi:MinD-like ATPase involved in chromosome partitioning or flagellar assembly